MVCYSKLLEDWGEISSLTACSINLESRDMSKTLLLAY